MLLTFQIVRHPLGRPEWLEVVCSFLCVAQTILALVVFEELPERQGLLLVFVILPYWAWAFGGAFLAAAHIWAIRKDSVYWRGITSIIGFGFWFHFAASVFATTLVMGTPMPMTLAPVLFVPMVYGGLAWRLTRYSVG